MPVIRNSSDKEEEYVDFNIYKVPSEIYSKLTIKTPKQCH